MEEWILIVFTELVIRILGMERLTNIISEWYFLPLQEATLDHLILSVITCGLVEVLSPS